MRVSPPSLLVLLSAALGAQAACTSPVTALYPSVTSGASDVNESSRDAVKITAYTVPTKAVNPYDIALGRAGNLCRRRPYDLVHEYHGQPGRQTRLLT